MKDKSLQEYVREQLHQLFPDSKDNGALTEVGINCPICNAEGNKDTNHHMWISVSEDKPFMFNCFRNSSHRGILTGDTLLKFVELETGYQVDPILLEEIDNHNDTLTHKKRYILNSSNTYSIENYYFKDPELIEIKRKYICSRLGLDLSYDELSNDKVVWSIKEVIQNNFINRTTRSQKDIDLLDIYFVGFMTNNNSSIILRNMIKEKGILPDYLDSRYIKYSIIPEASSGYYIIPTQCNIREHVEVHIAEGVFDVLSVFYNLRNANRVNNIYSSIGGNSYLNIIEYFLCNIGLIDVNFHIYIDNDIKPFVLPEIKSYLDPLRIDCIIHSNAYQGEKDFGVPKEKIKEFSYKL